MSKQNNAVWLIQLKHEQDQMKVSKHPVTSPTSWQKIQNETTRSKTILDLSIQGKLISVIVYDPQSSKPDILEIADSMLGKTNKEYHIVWTCLGIMIPKNTLAEQNGQNDSGDSDKMTYNQRRFLFRLLAQKKIKGEDAENHLKALLHVSDLKDALKTEASSLIEQLIAENGGGAS